MKFDVEIVGRTKICLSCRKEFIQEPNPNEEFLCISCQPKEKFVIGWVGHHKREIKHFELAQKAVSELRGCKLKVAGFMSLPHQSMPKFYKSIDCLLVTSESEAHPLPVYEAMAMCVPVITTPVGDILDTLVSGQNCIIINEKAEDSKYEPKKTISHIKTAISILKNNPSFSAKLVKNGIETIRKYWTWEKWVSSYDEHFELILTKNKIKKRQNIKMLICVDVHDWALEFTAKGMMKFLNRYYPNKYVFKIVTKDDYRSRKQSFTQAVNWADIVFTCWYFADCPFHKTTIKISGWEMIGDEKNFWITKILTEMKYVNTPSSPILHRLISAKRIIKKKKKINLPVIISHLSVGMDLEEFHR